MPAGCEPSCSVCLCTGIAAPAWHEHREREDAAGQLLEEQSTDLPIQESAHVAVPLLCPLVLLSHT